MKISYIAKIPPKLVKPLLTSLKVSLLCTMAVIVSCSMSNSNTSTTSDTPAGTQDIIIGNISTIPTDNLNANEYVLVYVNNNLDKKVTLEDTYLFNNGTKDTIKKLKAHLDSENCLQIDAYSSCRLRIYPNESVGNYLLQMAFLDSSGSIHNAVQVVSFRNMLPNTNGFIYDRNHLTVNENLENTLTVPFRLTKDYSDLKVLVDNKQVPFNCYQNSYQQGNLCYTIIDSDDLISQTPTMHKLELTGYNTGNNLTGYTIARLSLINTQNANLITSGVNMVINPDDGTSPQQVFLYNNGKATATNLIITPATPVIISSNTCGSTLAIGATCSFYINVTGSIPSGQSKVGVTYNDGKNTQAFYFNVSYISPTYSPGLTMMQSGNFTNVTVNSGTAYIALNIVNTGNTSLSNMQFTNINNQVSSMSSFVTGSTCYNGIDLSVNESCVMILSFNPTSAISGNVSFIPVGTYTGQSGESLTYVNSSLTIPYSSVTFPGFIVVGDYGSIFTALSSANTWSATINSPFNTNTISANNLLINNSTYVTTLSNGSVRYSTLNGLFWNSATATNLNASTCGLIYDGSFYYTCGTSATTLGNCTNTGRGCIIRTNNLTGTWSGLYQPAQAVAINNIYFFTGTSNNGYVATVANNTANTGLATSTTGSTFTATSSGQAGNGNNNMTCAVFNSTTQNVTAWNSVGWNSTRAIATIGTAWTANQTNRPANSSVNGAVFQNGLYSVANTAGDIYTTATATGTYAQVYSGTIQLNGITYGNGTYLSVGNTGTIVESATGGTWSTQTSYVVGQATNPNLISASYDGTNFWITGLNTIAKSPTTVPPSWTRPALTSITKNGSNYLAIDNQGFIYFSSNLTSWTQQSNPSNQVLNNIYCASTNLCFAVGNNGAIIKTTNGTTWTQLTSGTTATLKDIICQQGTCIIVGGTGTFGVVLTSNNNSTWTIQTSSLATTMLNSVAPLPGQLIAVGNTGTIFISTNNGISWQSVSSGTTNNLNGIACGNGCVAVGDSGIVRYSANGISWSTSTTTVTNTLNSVIYNGTFVATGNNGTIIFNQSPASTTWTTATSPSTSSSLTNLFAVISN